MTSTVVPYPLLSQISRANAAATGSFSQVITFSPPARAAIRASMPAPEPISRTRMPGPMARLSAWSHARLRLASFIVRGWYPGSSDPSSVFARSATLESPEASRKAWRARSNARNLSFLPRTTPPVQSDCGVLGPPFNATEESGDHPIDPLGRFQAGSLEPVQSSAPEETVMPRREAEIPSAR